VTIELNHKELYQHLTNEKFHASILSLKLDGREAALVSPVEGEVVAVNPKLAARDARVADDPYGRGWVLLARRDFADNRYADAASAYEKAIAASTKVAGDPAVQELVSNVV